MASDFTRMAQVVRIARFSVLMALLTCGCMDSASRVAQDENRRMDCLTRCGQELAEKSQPPITARSQAPEVLPAVRIGNPGRSVVDETPRRPNAPIQPIPNAVREQAPIVTIPPANPEIPVKPAAAEAVNSGDLQVRIVASVGNNPIYESEVREAMYFQLGSLPEFQNPSNRNSPAYAAKKKELFRTELRRLIEREMVIDEMTSFLTSKKTGNALQRIREAAAKTAESQITTMRSRYKLTEEQLKFSLRSDGLTLAGIRRQFERDFMMQMYIRDRFLDKVDKGVGLNDIRDYYDSNPGEFKSEDSVKWSDLFVMYSRFNTPAEAQQYAESLAAQARRGVNFSDLVKKYGHGDSVTRGGVGIGEKPGEIFPMELEQTILSLKTGDITIKGTETGLHVIKIETRNRAGVKPFDEKLQIEIRQKVKERMFEQESRRYIDTLWKRIQPQIWIDL